MPNAYFFLDKTIPFREIELIDKPLIVYCVGRVLHTKDKVIVEYENFLHEVEVVIDSSRLRPLSKTTFCDNLKIKKLSLSQLLNEIKTNEMTFNYFNKLSFSDMLNEVFNAKNNYLELLAIESIKQDVFLLGKDEDLSLAIEMVLLKLHCLVIMS